MLVSKTLILAAGVALAALVGGGAGYWIFGKPAPTPVAQITAPQTGAPQTGAAATPAAAPGSTAPGNAATAQANPAMPALHPDDMVLGSPDAKVTIIEYASLTCPHCRDFQRDTLPKIKAEFIDSGKAKLVFRDFPFDQASLSAAMLARCSGKERFFGFIDALYSTQDAWTREADWKAALARLAKLGGMSQADFDKCMADKSVEESVLGRRLEAVNKYGVDSTPTFFINGEKVSGAQPFDTFAAVIKRKAPAS